VKPLDNSAIYDVNSNQYQEFKKEFKRWAEQNVQEENEEEEEEIDFDNL
jgi:hypothetical protein